MTVPAQATSVPEATSAPPVAAIVPHTVVQQHWTLVDNYAWLQNKDNPAVTAYLEAENAYARAALRHTEPLQEQIFGEIRGQIKEDDSSAPHRHGDYFYYSRVEAGKQYRVFRKRGSHSTYNLEHICQPARLLS